MGTLFLQAPSYDGFDGGAGSRYQARREIRSFWYPTWLAQAAALVPDSKLIDAPPHGTRAADILRRAHDFDLAVLHTSAPSFSRDAAIAAAMKEANPQLRIGMVGATVAVEPQKSLAAATAVDFVAGAEFDFTIKEAAEGRALSAISGLSYRDGRGLIVHNPPRPLLEDMDRLPFVSPVYKRDLDVRKYFIGYLKHPYLSFYTGRGCKSRCTFCLWPQTVGGHRYRTRSVGHVMEEVRWALHAFPEVKEIFFDDDTFTDDPPRAAEIARELGKLGVVWSCNAKANVGRDLLKTMRANGLRLLLVGYESGNQQILHNVKKGMRVDVARRFTRDCHDLGIVIHGTFIIGLPGETKETVEETIRFLGLAGEADDECAVDDDPEVVAITSEAPRHIHAHPLLDIVQDLLIARLVADQEKAEAVRAHRFEQVASDVRFGVARPNDPELPELARDLGGARRVVGEGVVVEEYLFDFRECVQGPAHLFHDVSDAPGPVAVAADRLRPETERAARFAASPGVKGQIGVLQIADEVLSDVEVSFVDRRHEGQPVHVLEKGTRRIMNDQASPVSIRQAADRA